MDAYEKAIYVIKDKHLDITLRHNGSHELSDQLLTKYNAKLAGFITPENPFSLVLTDTENYCRHERFKSLLNDRNLPFLEGYGTDEVELWGKEVSYFVFAKSEEQLDLLSGLFGQNAYLFIAKNVSPKLKFIQSIQYSNHSSININD